MMLIQFPLPPSFCIRPINDINNSPDNVRCILLSLWMTTTNGLRQNSSKLTQMLLFLYFLLAYSALHQAINYWECPVEWMLSNTIAILTVGQKNVATNYRSPLLFLIHINDLLQMTTASSAALFADDPKCYPVDHMNNKRRKNSNTIRMEWASDVGWKLYQSKCCVVTVRRNLNPVHV